MSRWCRRELLAAPLRFTESICACGDEPSQGDPDAPSGCRCAAAGSSGLRQPRCQCPCPCEEGSADTGRRSTTNAVKAVVSGTEMSAAIAPDDRVGEVVAVDRVGDVDAGGGHYEEQRKGRAGVDEHER